MEGSAYVLVFVFNCNQFGAVYLSAFKATVSNTEGNTMFCFDKGHWSAVCFWNSQVQHLSILRGLCTFCSHEPSSSANNLDVGAGLGPDGCTKLHFLGMSAAAFKSGRSYTALSVHSSSRGLEVLRMSILAYFNVLLHTCTKEKKKNLFWHFAWFSALHITVGMVVALCQMTSVDTSVDFVGFHGVGLLSAAVSMCLSYYIQEEQYHTHR